MINNPDEQILIKNKNAMESNVLSMWTWIHDIQDVCTTPLLYGLWSNSISLWKIAKFTSLWKCSVHRLKFKINDYPITFPHVNYSVCQYEVNRIINNVIAVMQHKKHQFLFHCNGKKRRHVSLFKFQFIPCHIMCVNLLHIRIT